MLCAGCTSARPAPTPVIVHNACPKVSLCPMPGSDPETNGDLSADIRASPEQASMEFYGGKSPKIASVHQFGLSEETRKDGKKIDYPARPLLGFTGEDVQMIEEIILAHLDR
ncbi:Rz1-like lysis system protein LysC [Escherichia coli]